MVELELEKPINSPMKTVRVHRRRITYKPSMLVDAAGSPVSRKPREKIQPFSLPEWMVPQDLLPPFIQQLSARLGLSEKENRIHSALSGVLLWENFYLKYRDTLTSPQQMPSYLLGVIVPDFRALISSFSEELGRDVFAVNGALERANHFISETQKKGEYFKKTNVFLYSSPFMPLYRSASRIDLAPFHQLYDSVILKPERFVQHSHDFFVNKDQTFFSWVLGNLKNHYAVH